MLRKIAIRLFFTFILFAALFAFAEWYLRKQLTYIVQSEIDKSGGFLEATPEFLVHFTPRGRRFVPNAHVVIKNHFLSHQDIKMDINALGFRGAEVPATKSADELRLMFLGDSVTVVDYLPEEQIFTSLIEKDLSRVLPSRKVVSINAAIGNIGIEEEVNILEDTLSKVQPDVIILNFYLNDSRTPWGFSGEIGDRGWLRKRSLVVEATYRVLEEQRWIAKQEVDRFGWVKASEELDWKHKPEELKKLAALAEYDWGSAWNETSWEKVQTQLQRLKELAAETGAKVVVVAFPVSFQVQAEYVDDGPQKKVAQLAKEAGFEFFDVLPTLRSNSSENLFYDQCHLTAKGNELVAGAVGKFLLKSVILNQTKPE
ncbi:MAG: SGNH/GDSL hydrolase family protein [Deltaproteobacteria bacterium]|nr:SGNH/GDSL hydrolase family protein [Deltaproteobacteria bacterium]